MKKFILLSVFSLLLLNSYAQPFSKLLGGANNEVFNSIKQTSDGGYIAVGNTNTSGGGLNDILLTKFTSSGNVQWSKTYGSANEELGVWVEITTLGTYMIAGVTSATSTANADMMLLEVNSTGTSIIWSKVYATTLHERVKNIINSPAGFLICGDQWDGRTVPNGTNFDGTVNLLMLELDFNKNLLWQTVYNRTENGSTGLKGDLASYAIPVGTDGYYIIGGSYMFSGYDQTIIRLNADNTVRWAKNWGDVAGQINGNDNNCTIIPIGNDEVIVAGSMRRNSADFTLTKFNSTGTIQWWKEYSDNTVTTSYMNDERPFKCVLTNENNILGLAVIGQTVVNNGSGNIFMAKTDINGNLSWVNSWGGTNTETTNDMIVSSDGSFVIAASSASAGAAATDACIIKTDNNGKISDNYCQTYGITTTSRSATATNITFLRTQPVNILAATATLTIATFNGTLKNALGCTMDCQNINSSFSGLSSIVCPNADPLTLTGTPAGGTFSGQGITNGNVFNPTVSGAGTFTISYNISGGTNCPNTTSRKVVVLPKSPTINRVISAQVNTLSDNWPLNSGNIPVSVNLTPANFAQLMAKDPFINGSKGLMKTEESYAYVEDRKQSPYIKSNVDGTFDNMPLFLWNNAGMEGCYPGWRKGKTITSYNPFNYELENKDILNLRSASLYGYHGDLAIATAENASQKEIAYEGFEEYTAGQPISPQTVSRGNLTLLTYNAPASDFTNEVYDEYEVVLATDNQATLNVPLAKASWLNGKTIKIHGAKYGAYNDKIIHYNATVTGVTADPENALQCLLSFTTTEADILDIWKGKISILYTPSVKPYYAATSAVSIVGKPAYSAHTGTKSLYVNGKTEIEQVKLKLTPGKKYVISGWVKGSAQDTLTYQSAPDVAAGLKRSIGLEFLDAAENLISAPMIAEPSGMLIEGWQKIEGEVIVPASAVKTILLLNPGNTQSLFDDIRIFPSEGNLQSYVYNSGNYKLNAILDRNNYATLYYYDEAGNLFLLKKETERGIQTIQESYSHQVQH